MMRQTTPSTHVVRFVLHLGLVLVLGLGLGLGLGCGDSSDGTGDATPTTEDGGTCQPWDEAQFVDPAPYQPIDLSSSYASATPEGVVRSFTGLDRDAAHRQCVQCHDINTPGEVERWRGSRHAQAASPVLCLDCHGTENHGRYTSLGYEFKSRTLSIDGTTEIGNGETHQYAEWFPKMVVEAMQSCQRAACHARNYEQHVGPRRVPAGAEATTPVHGMLRYDHGISSWNDTMMTSFGLALWETYGIDVFRENCVRCHSQTMAFNVAGDTPSTMSASDAFLGEMLTRQATDIPSFDRMALPGIEKKPLVLVRCVECHVRHTFSRSSPRQPIACAKCHSGPDHPQIEAYETSKHALVLAEHGPHSHENPSGGPGCATCHLSVDPNAVGIGGGPAIDHDLTIGLAANYPATSTAWTGARERMLDRCGQCHARQYAAVQLLSADEVARDATAALMVEIQTLCKAAYDRGLIEPAPNPFFGEPVPFLPTFFHAMPWRSGKYRVSNIEAACWDAWREFGVLSQETGAWHFSPQHAQWRGVKVAEEFIGELRDLLAFEGAGYCVAESPPP
ncbi:MAG: hypothetical protein IT384_13835 [Deltaproteobacteria bacterium]|nr:hypothetical protein [Deltaproteobacteria bacterium]